MKKGLIIVLCVVLVVALGVGGFFVWQSMNKIPNITTPSGDEIVTQKSLSEQTVVTPVVVKQNSGTNREVDAIFPAISSFKNKNFEDYINEQIRTVIFSYKDEISTITYEGTPSTAFYSYKATYEKYTHGDYLSLVISNDYQTGGIRTNTWKDTYNIDVRNERIIHLEDIFPANVDYEKEIINEVTKQAEAKNYVLMNGLGLTALDVKQKFYIEDNKLIIYFDAAEIAPATYGALQFEMPFTLGEDGKFSV